jgi:hypothetical protein
VTVKVDLDKLADALADYAFGYLITVSDDFRAHTVAVRPQFTDGLFDVGVVGKHTRGNAAQRPDITLLWPPREDGGYTLIVDGRAAVTGDTVQIEPTRAVLHRSATSASVATSPDGLHDCVPLKN